MLTRAEFRAYVDARLLTTPEAFEALYAAYRREAGLDW